MATALIPHSRPCLGEAEAEAARHCVKSGQLASGPLVEALEARLAALLGHTEGVAVSSGTAGLHLALLALGIGAGDEVILPAYSCASLLQAVRMVGADPLLCDVSEATAGLSEALVRPLLSSRTKVLLAPHLFGKVGDLRWVPDLGLTLVEDCAHCTGGWIAGGPAGRFGTLAVTSLYATKLVTCGEGGLIACSDVALAARLRDLRSCDHREGPGIRFNYKMSDLAASVGLVQLDRLNLFLDRRRAIAARYRQALMGGTRVRPLFPPGDAREVVFRFCLVEAEGLVEEMRRCFREKGILVERPIYHPLWQELPGSSPLPGSAWLHEHLFSVPLYPALEEQELERVQEILSEVAR